MIKKELPQYFILKKEIEEKQQYRGFYFMYENGIYNNDTPVHIEPIYSWSWKETKTRVNCKKLPFYVFAFLMNSLKLPAYSIIDNKYILFSRKLSFLSFSNEEYHRAENNDDLFKRLNDFEKNMTVINIFHILIKICLNIL